MAGVVRSDIKIGDQNAIQFPHEEGLYIPSGKDIPLELSLNRSIDDTNVFSLLNDETKRSLGRAAQVSINLESYSKITDAAIHFIAVATPGLKKINLKSCVNITDKAVETISHNCPNLEEIDLSWCDISENSLYHLGEHCKNLTRIGVRSCYITDRSVVYLLEQCPKIKTLSLAWCKSLTDVTLRAMAEYPNFLETFDIRGNERITAPGLITLFTQKNTFKTVHLKRCINVTDAVLQKLTLSAPTLTKLNLRGCDHGHKLTVMGLKHLIEHCNSLESLDLAWHGYITDEILFSLSKHCPKLKNLDISGCHLLTDMGIKSLFSGCPQLKKVIVFNSPEITNNMVHHVNKDQLIIKKYEKIS